MQEDSATKRSPKNWFISLSTVKTHLASIQTKLALRNRVEIARHVGATRRAPQVGIMLQVRKDRVAVRPDIVATTVIAEPELADLLSSLTVPVKMRAPTNVSERV